MICINKQPSEAAKIALSQFIKQQNSAGIKPHYDDFKKSKLETLQESEFEKFGREHVQASLLEEQGYLCAYCMKRINEIEKIEHWIPRSVSNQNENNLQTLDYNNMIAVCKGRIPEKKEDDRNFGEKAILHCDSSRADSNRLLSVNPVDKSTISQIKYLKNGVIYHENPNIENANYEQKCSEIDKDLSLSNSLNLNNLHLIDERKSVYEDFREIIRIKCQKLPTNSEQAKSVKQKAVREWQEKHLDKKDNKYKYRPYCGVILYHYRKYLT